MRAGAGLVSIHRSPWGSPAWHQPALIGSHSVLVSDSVGAIDSGKLEGDDGQKTGVHTFLDVGDQTKYLRLARCSELQSVVCYLT